MKKRAIPFILLVSASLFLLILSIQKTAATPNATLLLKLSRSEFICR